MASEDRLQEIRRRLAVGPQDRRKRVREGFERVGSNLRRMRREFGFNQADLAWWLGWNRSTIHRIETGKTSFRVARLYTLSAFWGVSPYDFLATEPRWSTDSRWSKYGPKMLVLSPKALAQLGKMPPDPELVQERLRQREIALRKAVGANIRNTRKRSIFSTTADAKIAQSTWKKIESGNRNPSLEVLEEIAAAQHLDVWELLDVDVEELGWRPNWIDEEISLWG